MRPWREIAQELTQQTNRKKIAELSEELNQALIEQGIGEPKNAPPEAAKIPKD